MKRALVLAAGVLVCSISEASLSETATFEYDGLGRLTQSFKQGGGADGTLTAIAHDPADNRGNYTVLNTVKTLHANDRVYSPDGRFYLTLKSNGEIAVVTAATSAELWNSGTSTLATDHASFRSDGNLVLLSATAATLWSSATSGHPAAQLAMQSDGNLVINDDTGTPIWQSNTGGH